jgi:hypothetical protein
MNPTIVQTSNYLIRLCIHGLRLQNRREITRGYYIFPNAMSAKQVKGKFANFCHNNLNNLQILQ